MKRMKKLMALAVAMTMFLSVACDGNSANEATTTTTAATTAPAGTDPADTDDTETETDDNTEEPGDTNIYPDPNKPVTLSLFADYTWLDFDRLDGIVPAEIERLTGVTLDFTKATDAQQLTLLISGGDYPDLMSTGSTSKLYMVSHPDVSYSYNELIEQYAPDWDIPEIEQKSNAYYSEDDNFYFLRNNFNTVEQLEDAKNLGLNYGQFHMRGDIYEELGSPEVKDVESFFELLHMVDENYEDMIPMVLNYRAYGAYAGLVGYDPGKPVDEDGNYVHAFSDPKHKDYMALINRTYREGLMTQENFAYNSDEQSNQLIANGTAFMTTFFAGNDEQVFTSMVDATVPGATFVQMPLADDWTYTFDVTGWSVVAISKNNPDPETSIKLIRWAKDNQLTSMLGVEGEDWTLNDDGTVTNGPRMVAALEDGTVEQAFNPMTFVLAAADYITESQARFYSSATQATREIQDEAASRASYTNVLGLCWPPSDSDEGVISSNLTSLSSEYFSILGMAETEEDFEAKYAEFMNEAMDIGLEELSAYLTDRYETVSAELNAE